MQWGEAGAQREGARGMTAESGRGWAVRALRRDVLEDHVAAYADLVHRGIQVPVDLSIDPEVYYVALSKQCLWIDTVEPDDVGVAHVLMNKLL